MISTNIQQDKYPSGIIIQSRQVNWQHHQLWARRLTRQTKLNTQG